MKILKTRQVNCRISEKSLNKLNYVCGELEETKSTFIETAIDERVIKMLKQLNRGK